MSSTVLLGQICGPGGRILNRGLLKDELRALGLDSYDPLQIVEKTGGRTAEDDLWLKIQYRGDANNGNS